jgi:hypothetical protein
MLFRNSDWSRTFVDDALAFLEDEAKQVSSKGSCQLLCMFQFPGNACTGHANHTLQWSTPQHR